MTTQDNESAALLTMYWNSEPPCYIVAASKDDALTVMNETWNSTGKDETLFQEIIEEADPIEVPGDTVMALIEAEGTSYSGYEPLGPAVSQARYVELKTATQWIQERGRGLLVEYEP